MSEIIQIICDECCKVKGISELQGDERITVTVRVPQCSDCAFETGYREGYKLGYSEGYLAKERGAKFR